MSERRSIGVRVSLHLRRDRIRSVIALSDRVDHSHSVGRPRHQHHACSGVNGQTAESIRECDNDSLYIKTRVVPPSQAPHIPLPVS